MDGPVAVFTTGGTIGAFPYPDPVNPPETATMPDGADLVALALRTTFREIPTRLQSLEPRDSRRIDRAYRSGIADLIARASEPGIVITHGTDTIVETADFLFRDSRANPERYRDRTVILTGSMTPLANGDCSDGYRNLEAALTLAAGAGNPGIGVVLHARDEHGRWNPVLHRIRRPNQYTKFKGDDGRYYRLTARES